LEKSEQYSLARRGTGYAVFLSTNGVLHAEDVPPGEYRLSCQYFDPKTVQPGRGYTQMTQFYSTQTITIPASADAANPEPFDCGTLDLQSEVVEFPQDPSQQAVK
jgi:hypothetical protein